MKYEVIVGNVGTVYRGASYSEAHATFNTYRAQSRLRHGRAAGEPVTLMVDGEPTREHPGTQETQDHDQA